jgi:hypothetical protein
MLLVSMLFLGPLGWVLWRDRSQARSDAIRAEVRAAVNRRLGGESVLSVMVFPQSFWRAGRIVLSTPSGYEWLGGAVWRDALDHAPAGYEVVMTAPASGAADSTHAAAHPLARAA